MAWQTPKTNWGAADGVRDTDFNRIEENIQFLYDDAKVRQELAVYVNAGTGNDNTGTGSPSAPYKTITKALSAIPKDLNGMRVVVNIANGTYPEDVLIKGFGGMLLINGAYDANITVNSFIVSCSTVELVGMRINATTDGGIVARDNGCILGTGTLVSTGGGACIAVGGSVITVNVIEVSNNPSFAVIVDGGSNLNALYIQGSNNVSGIICQGGSVASFSSNNLTANGAVYTTYAGGRILSGSQVAAPNY